jgi:plastocyanin
MKSILIGSCTALVLAVAVACGGSSGGGAPQTQPSGVPSGGTNVNATTISILGDRGGASFTPNPAPSGASDLAFKNNDSQIHHIVANDGSFDSGDIAPGATKTVSLASDGTNYHCTIHPDMIGAVSASDGAPPRCTGIYC